MSSKLCGNVSQNCTIIIIISIIAVQTFVFKNPVFWVEIGMLGLLFSQARILQRFLLVRILWVASMGNSVENLKTHTSLQMWGLVLCGACNKCAFIAETVKTSQKLPVQNMPPSFLSSFQFLQLASQFVDVLSGLNAKGSDRYNLESEHAYKQSSGRIRVVYAHKGDLQRKTVSVRSFFISL